MKKAICLVRVSTAQQDISQQTEKVKAEAIKDGYKDIIIIEDVESAVKLSEEERNGLNRLKEHILSDNTIDIVYAYEISRISRQVKIVYSIRDFLMAHHVQLCILNPYFKMLKDDGTLSETSNIFFGIFASMAENEGYIRKARLRRGKEKAKAQGRHVGGVVMFGYTTDRQHYYKIDKFTGEIVKRIFFEYVDNHKTIRKIARELQSEGYFKGITYLTCVQEVNMILHRECYCGEGPYPAIISRETYNQAQQNMKDNSLKIRIGENLALCKWILRDKNMGLLLTHNSSSRLYFSKRKAGCCCISAKIIDPITWDLAVRIHRANTVMDRDKVMKELDEKLDVVKGKFVINMIKTRELTERRDLIEERLIMGKLSKTKAEQLEKRTDEELKSLLKDIGEIRDEQKRIEETKEKYENMKTTEYDYDNMDERARYDLVHEVFNKILLSREGSVAVIEYYNNYTRDIDIIKYNPFKKKFI